MKRRTILFTFVVMLLLSFSMVSAQQSKLKPAVKKSSYPKIVLYSVSWCPHCRAAKQYMNYKEIPYVNYDVEIDKEALKVLKSKYKSEGVPVLIIGDDEEILMGFTVAKFKAALKRVQQKKRKR